MKVQYIDCKLQMEKYCISSLHKCSSVRVDNIRRKQKRHHLVKDLSRISRNEGREWLRQKYKVDGNIVTRVT